MTNMGASGPALHFLINYKIPVNGHLVAWQYYIGYRSRPCTSYAVIWRETNGNYLRITETKLSPVEPESGGIRFQYVQDSTVAVHKGDFLGFYTDTSVADCRGNLISFRNDNPSDEDAIIYNYHDWQSRPSSLPVIAPEKSEYYEKGKRGVALKAFIAGRCTSIAL